MMTLKMRMMRDQSWNWSKGLLVRIHRNWEGEGVGSTLILLSFTLGSRAGRTGVSPPDPGASRRVSSGRELGVFCFACFYQTSSSSFMPPAASTEDTRMTSQSKDSNTRLYWKRILVMSIVELGMTAKVESQKWCVGRGVVDSGDEKFVVLGCGQIIVVPCRGQWHDNSRLHC